MQPLLNPPPLGEETVLGQEKWSDNPTVSPLPSLGYPFGCNLGKAGKGGNVLLLSGFAISQDLGKDKPIGGGAIASSTSRRFPPQTGEGQGGVKMYWFQSDFTLDKS